MPHRGGDLARHAEDGVGSQGQDPVEEVLDPDQKGTLLCHHVVGRAHQDLGTSQGAEPAPEVGGEEMGVNEIEVPLVQILPDPGHDGKIVAAPLGNERHRNPQGLEVGSQLPPGLDHQDRGPDFRVIEVFAELQEMVLCAVEGEGGKDVADVDRPLLEGFCHGFGHRFSIASGNRPRLSHRALPDKDRERRQRPPPGNWSVRPTAGRPRPSPPGVPGRGQVPEDVVPAPRNLRGPRETR